jgi:hypothetical protein
MSCVLMQTPPMSTIRLLQLIPCVLLLWIGEARAQLTHPLSSTVLLIDEVVDSSRVDKPWEILWGPDDRLWMTDGPRIVRWDPATDVIDTLLGRSTAELLRNYMEHYRPTEHLFAGQNGGPYSARSLQKVLEQALHKTGIAKRATIHTFAAFIRHTPLGTRHRPAIHPSTPRPCQQQDHRDLHPCQYALPPRHHQPHGCAGRGLTSILAKASQCMPQ